MHYSEMRAPREVIRGELIGYLRDNIERLRLPPPPTNTGADWTWFTRTKGIGMLVSEVVNEVYNSLLSSNSVQIADISVPDSTVMNAYQAYNPLKAKQAIMEELMELIRMGVLLQTRYQPADEGRSFDFSFELPSEYVVLSEWGTRFLDEQIALPYFVDSYIHELEQIEPLNDALRGYLSEGMICLRHQLARASIILLRLAAENVLAQLIDEIQTSLATETQKNKFKGNVRKAYNSIQERAEVVFQQLEHGGLLQEKDHLREEMKNQLRGAFHSIRKLGGKAAHLSEHIQPGEAAAHYILFAYSVYPIAARIAQHLRQIQT